MTMTKKGQDARLERHRNSNCSRRPPAQRVPETPFLATVRTQLHFVLKRKAKLEEVFVVLAMTGRLLADFGRILVDFWLILAGFCYAFWVTTHKFLDSAYRSLVIVFFFSYVCFLGSILFSQPWRSRPRSFWFSKFDAFLKLLEPESNWTICLARTIRTSYEYVGTLVTGEGMLFHFGH